MLQNDPGTLFSIGTVMTTKTKQDETWLAPSWQRSREAGLRQTKTPENIRVSSASVMERKYKSGALKRKERESKKSLIASFTPLTS